MFNITNGDCFAIGTALGSGLSCRSSRACCSQSSSLQSSPPRAPGYQRRCKACMTNGSAMPQQGLLRFHRRRAGPRSSNQSATRGFLHFIIESTFFNRKSTFLRPHTCDPVVPLALRLVFMADPASSDHRVAIIVHGLVDRDCNDDREEAGVITNVSSNKTTKTDHEGRDNVHPQAVNVACPPTYLR